MIEKTELRTRRLLLRPWRLGDVDDAIAYAADPEWGRYLWVVPQPYTRSDAEEFVSRAVSDPWLDQAQFAIEYQGHAVGGVRLHFLDQTAGFAGLGYNVARFLWGRGIATEAAGAVLTFGFETLGLAKLSATADARNAASIRVMEKLGMRFERTGQRHARGEDVSEVWYSLLRSQWSAGFKERDIGKDA